MLRQLIRQGEGETVDFKHTITSPRKIAKTLVAFANTKGGRIRIGVKDNGAVCGTRADEEKHMLTAAAELSWRPAVKLGFSEALIDGRIGFIAEVKDSETKPHLAE